MDFPSLCTYWWLKLNNKILLINLFQSLLKLRSLLNDIHCCWRWQRSFWKLLIFNKKLHPILYWYQKQIQILRKLRLKHCQCLFTSLQRHKQLPVIVSHVETFNKLVYLFKWSVFCEIYLIKVGHLKLSFWLYNEVF